MPPRLPALLWRLAWMSSTLSAHPPLHPQASGLRTRTPPSLNPYRRVGESGTILKNLSKAQQQPITPRIAFANYVKDSLLTMSKAKYKKARSTINKLLSDLMDEDSDDDMMMTGGMEAPATPSTQQASYSQLRHPLRPSSTLSVGSSASSTSEKYQPQPHMWRNVPPASSVWFTVYRVYGAVPPATLPAFTSADASYSSTKNCASSSATSPADSAAAAAHPHPSVCCLGFCCPGTERPAQSNPAQSRPSL